MAWFLSTYIDKPDLLASCNMSSTSIQSCRAKRHWLWPSHFSDGHTDVYGEVADTDLTSSCGRSEIITQVSRFLAQNYSLQLR